ncbi:MAG: helix-turn-helix transcriptional regulator [Eubacteriales bacterium]|nr:helix-turn-helix transcriptional regulator [Eubacteriales bacterium]
MFDKNKFAGRVQSLRKSIDLNQQQLAGAIGVTKSTISRIESASRAASIEIIYALANYFDVSIDYLVGRSDDPKRY